MAQGSSAQAWGPLLFCGGRSFQNRCWGPRQPGRCLSGVCPPLGSLLSQASLTKPRRPKLGGLPEKPRHLFAPRAPDPGASPEDRSGPVRKSMHNLVNFGWDAGPGFSKGHRGGAGDFVPEAPLPPGRSPGRPLPSPCPAVIPPGLYSQR